MVGVNNGTGVGGGSEEWKLEITLLSERWTEGRE